MNEHSESTTQSETMDFTIIRKLESKMFPELAQTGKSAFTAKDPDAPLQDCVYVEFGPSYYFDQGLIDNELMRSFTAQTKLLSIGSGHAYLEQYLCAVSDLKPEMVTLSDIESITVPGGFAYVRINMNEEDWGIAPHSQDVIIFPNTIFFAKKIIELRTARASQTEQELAFLATVECAVKYLKPGGQIRFNVGACLDNA
jgi:hypothetical protein